jgi:hypothetical protein
LIKAQFFYKINSNNSNISIPLILQGVLINLFFYTFNLFFLVEYPELTDYRPKIESLNYVKSLKLGSWKKFIWSIQRSILITLIGNGWNWQISSNSFNEKNRLFNNKSNWLKNFIFNKLLLKYTIYDVFFHLYISTDYIESNGCDIDHVNDLIFFNQNSKISFFKQLILAFGSVYCIYFGIDILYDISIFINVFLLKTSNLNDYYHLFGSFKNDYTIKSLWGNVWHKLMYQLAVPQSKYLTGCDYKAKHLNKNPRFGNEIWRKYLMYFMVFIFTGLFHAAGTLNMPWSNGLNYNINIPYHDYFINHLPFFTAKCFYSFIFFPAQFILILIENCVQYLFKRMINIKLPHNLKMTIGLTWIALSEMYLLQLYMDELVKSGFDVKELVVPFTPVHLIFSYFNIKF